MPVGNRKIYIFVPKERKTMGLTGFDSVAKWYVSMQWVGNFHLNLSYQNFIWQQ